MNARYGAVAKFRQAIQDGEAKIRPLCRDEEDFKSAMVEVQDVYRTTVLDWPAAFDRVYHRLAARR